MLAYFCLANDKYQIIIQVKMFILRNESNLCPLYQYLLFVTSHPGIDMARFPLTVTNRISKNEVSHKVGV